MEWLTVAVWTVWNDSGELSNHVSKWQMYAKLVQLICELNMKQAMFNLNMRGPNDEPFMTGMWNLVLGTVSSTASDLFVATLAPYVGRHYMK